MAQPTIREVAKRAAVSLGTVSNYLNDNKPIAPHTRARIEHAIEDLGFVPNRAVKVMRGARAPAIGYVVSDSPDPFFVEVARGVEDVARARGFVLVSCNTQGSREYERNYVTALAEMRVAGAIVMPSFEHSDMPFRALRAAGAGVVVLGGWDDQTCSISFDDDEGGRLAARHLISLGHSDILYVGGPGGEHQIEHRFNGAKAAIAEAGLPSGALRRIDAASAAISDRDDLANQLLSMSPRPTAVLCASDSLALAVLNGLLRQGVSVPGDVAIVGFNNIDAARLAVVPLTTIAIPQYEQGEMAARMLLDELEPGHRHEQIVLQADLIVRASTVGH